MTLAEAVARNQPSEAFLALYGKEYVEGYREALGDIPKATKIPEREVITKLRDSFLAERGIEDAKEYELVSYDIGYMEALDDVEEDITTASLLLLQ